MGALGGMMVGFSGCLGGLLGASTPAAITNTTLQPFKLIVKLHEEVKVSAVNLISPNGTTVSSKSVSAGQTTVGLPLIQATNGTPKALAPGTYQVVVANNNKTVDQKEIQLDTLWDLTDVMAKNSKDMVISIRNSGQLPVKLTYLGVIAGVPNPNDPPQNSSLSPIRIDELNRDQLTQFIGNGNRATFRVPREPFQFYAITASTPQWQHKAVKCRGLTHEATLVLTMEPTGKRTYSVPITYGGESNRNLGGHLCSNIAINNISKS